MICYQYLRDHLSICLTMCAHCEFIPCSLQLKNILVNFFVLDFVITHSFLYKIENQIFQLFFKTLQYLKFCSLHYDHILSQDAIHQILSFTLLFIWIKTAISPTLNNATKWIASLSPRWLIWPHLTCPY